MSSVAIKKGNKEGKTELYHKNIPFFADVIFSVENNNKNNIKRQMETGIIRDLILKKE